MPTIELPAQAGWVGERSICSEDYPVREIGADRSENAGMSSV